MSDNAIYAGGPMGVQEEAALSEGTSRVTTADLLDAANDPAVTARTLEFWRHQDLLPKAVRTGQRGKHPEWSYPSEALDQLGALMRLRTKTKDPNVLRAALWFDGFPVETALARTSVAAVLGSFLKVLTREVDKRVSPDVPAEAATSAALDHIGRLLAGKRGPKAPPRYGRQSSEERGRAMALGLGLVLGDEGSVARLERDAPLLERMIGVDRGRRPRGPFAAWMEGPAAEGLEAFAHYGSLPALIETVATATDDEMTASRALARIVLDGMTALARISNAIVGVDNPVGFGSISLFRDDPGAVTWMLAFLIGIGRSPTLRILR